MATSQTELELQMQQTGLTFKHKLRDSVAAVIILALLIDVLWHVLDFVRHTAS